MADADSEVEFMLEDVETRRADSDDMDNLDESWSPESEMSTESEADVDPILESDEAEGLQDNTRCEREEHLHEEAEYNEEVAAQAARQKHFARLQVQYLYTHDGRVHTSKPYQPSPVKQRQTLQSFQVARLAKIKNAEWWPRQPQLQFRSWRSTELLPPDVLLHWSPLQVLLHDLDSTLGPLPRHGTELRCGQERMTDAWSWQDLMERSNANNIVSVHIICGPQEPLTPCTGDCTSHMQT